MDFVGTCTTTLTTLATAETNAANRHGQVLGMSRTRVTLCPGPWPCPSTNSVRRSIYHGSSKKKRKVYLGVERILRPGTWLGTTLFADGKLEINYEGLPRTADTGVPVSGKTKEWVIERGGKEVECTALLFRPTGCWRLPCHGFPRSGRSSMGGHGFVVTRGGGYLEGDRGKGTTLCSVVFAQGGAICMTQ